MKRPRISLRSMHVPFPLGNTSFPIHSDNIDIVQKVGPGLSEFRRVHPFAPSFRIFLSFLPAVSLAFWSRSLLASVFQSHDRPLARRRMFLQRKDKPAHHWKLSFPSFTGGGYIGTKGRTEHVLKRTFLEPWVLRSSRSDHG